MDQRKSVPTGGPYIVTYVIDMKLQGGVKTVNKEKKEDSDNESGKRSVDRFGIVKQYDYMFTGINPVMDVDISLSLKDKFFIC